MVGQDWFVYYCAGALAAQLVVINIELIEHCQSSVCVCDYCAFTALLLPLGACRCHRVERDITDAVSGCDHWRGLMAPRARAAVGHGALYMHSSARIVAQALKKVPIH